MSVQASQPQEEAENASPPLNGTGTADDANSKHSFRQSVWEYLEKNRLVSFPRPAFGRIPNFKGAEQATAKLSELKEFQNSKYVVVSPDKPLEFSRTLVLENSKVLYVPVPRLHEGLLKKLSFCEEDKPINIKQCVSSWGIEALGKSVGFADKIRIDLLVLGSVAVSKNGHRIGKGKGFADLEFAILKEMKAITDDTVIVTTVHDCQVFDALPVDLFKEHDVPVDYIITPTQVIEVEKKLPRPEGIYWGLLSQRNVTMMPILQKIKDILASEGKDTTLKSTETDSETDEKSRSNRNRFSKKRTVKPDTENGETPSPSSQRGRRGRYFKPTESAKIDKENEEPQTGTNESQKKKPRPQRRFSRRPPIDFSLVVSNIDKNVRVRELKTALIDHGIKPSNITWRGYKGFCYLHYVKPGKKEGERGEKPFAVDNVIEILQTLKLGPEEGNKLTVKVMEPVTRIETTDVTAV